MPDIPETKEFEGAAAEVGASVGIDVGVEAGEVKVTRDADARTADERDAADVVDEVKVPGQRLGDSRPDHGDDGGHERQDSSASHDDADAPDDPHDRDQSKVSADDDETAPAPQWRPIVERHRLPIAIATVVLMAGIAVRLGAHFSTLPVLAFATTAVALAVVDFAILRLPNPLVAASGALVVLAVAIQAVAERRTHLLVIGAEGAVGVAAFYLLLYVVSRGGLGLGDVKLGAVAGFLMASRDWQHVFDGSFLAYVVTLVIAVGMMVRGRRKFPYGPGILAGTIAVMLLS